MTEDALTFRRFKDGDGMPYHHSRHIVVNGHSHKCPTYIHRTPPCRGSCPSGHDIRGWLSVVRGLDKPASDLSWQEYVFHRMAEANPFPAIMGRVCPAPCQDGCNRNVVEEHVGINSVKQFVGNWAIANNITFPPPAKKNGRKITVVGGGPGGLAAAYFLRRKGHAITVFKSYSALGGMMRFGIPGYRMPKNVLDAAIQRILEMGVEIRLNTRVRSDIPMGQLEKDFDAVFLTLGIASGEVPNGVTGFSFLRAFNEGCLQHLHARVLVIDGGDTAMDVAAVARRIGHTDQVSNKDRAENVILGYTAYDVASVACREGADAWIIYCRPLTKMPATKHELESVQKAGVLIKESLIPLEAIQGPDGRATALRVMPVEWEGSTMIPPHEEKTFNTDCSPIVSIVGQGGDFTGIESLNNGRGLISADRFYRVSSRKGHFIGRDIIRPHLLTTAIGHTHIACDSIDHYLRNQALDRRPRVDVYHFNLLDELRSRGPELTLCAHEEVWGTNSARFAVHNFEDDRSAHAIGTYECMFLGHSQHAPMNRRAEVRITADDVLSNFQERFISLDEKQAVHAANRCMSCGLCFECDQCLVYCPQIAISRVAKKERAMGCYVDINYAKYVGRYICMDVCPSGSTQMGMGEG